MTTRTTGGAKARAPLSSANAIDDKGAATVEGGGAILSPQTHVEKNAGPNLTGPNLTGPNQASPNLAEVDFTEAEMDVLCEKLTLVPDVCYVLGLAHDTDTGGGAVTLLCNGSGQWALEASSSMINATRQMVALTGILEAIDHIRKNVVRAAYKSDDAQIIVVIRHDDIAAHDTIAHVFSNDDVIDSISCPAKAMLMREICAGMVALSCDGIDVRLYRTCDADIAEIDKFASAESRRALARAHSRRAAQVVTPFAVALQNGSHGAATPESLAHRRAARFFAIGVKTAIRASAKQASAKQASSKQAGAAALKTAAPKTASLKAAASKTAASRKGATTTQNTGSYVEVNTTPEAASNTAHGGALRRTADGVSQQNTPAGNSFAKEGQPADNERPRMGRRSRALRATPPASASPAAISKNPYFERGYALALKSGA